MPANRNTRREPSLLVGSQVTVTVEKLAVGGAGVARHEGMVVFIPQAAPNETLLVEIVDVKKNFSEAKIIQIVKMTCLLCLWNDGIIVLFLMDIIQWLQCNHGCFCQVSKKFVKKSLGS